MNTDSDHPSAERDDPLDVDGILHTLRKNIRQRAATPPDFDTVARGEVQPVAPKRLPAQVHEAVFRAERLHDQTRLPLPHAAPGRSLAQRMRDRLRSMILCSVDAAADRQIAFNAAAANAISELVAALEAEGAHTFELQREIELLRERIEALEKQP